MKKLPKSLQLRKNTYVGDIFCICNLYIMAERIRWNLSISVFVVAPFNRVKRHRLCEYAKPQRWSGCANRETLNSKWDINVHCQLPRSRAPARGEQLTVYRQCIADEEVPTGCQLDFLYTDEVRSAVSRSIRNSRFSPGRSTETNIARDVSHHQCDENYLVVTQGAMRAYKRCTMFWDADWEIYCS